MYMVAWMENASTNRQAPTYEERQRLSKRVFYSSSFWQRLCLAVLERDGWRCVPEHEGCRFKEPGSLKTAGKGVAHVHHKIDRADGGEDRVENLVATCRAYNLGETRRRQAARARRERERERGNVASTFNAGPSRDW
jgi:5-methylcytosine-specific restriction endonuclease McrA